MEISFFVAPITDLFFHGFRLGLHEARPDIRENLEFGFDLIPRRVELFLKELYKKCRFTCFFLRQGKIVRNWVEVGDELGVVKDFLNLVIGERIFFLQFFFVKI